jgi:hypothetical protein
MSWWYFLPEQRIDRSHERWPEAFHGIDANLFRPRRPFHRFSHARKERHLSRSNDGFNLCLVGVEVVERDDVSDSVGLDPSDLQLGR